MKIKTRITLYIVCVCLFASIIISSFLLYEALEQPIRILDGVLYEDGHRIVSQLAAGMGGTGERQRTASGWRPPVWISVYDTELGKTVYVSENERISPMRQLEPGKKGIMRVAHPLPPEPLGREKIVILRARSFAVVSEGRTFNVQTARPMEKLLKEILEMLAALAVGLICAVAASFALARVASKRILRPIKEIKELAHKISDENLDERIPVSAEKDELSELAETLNSMLDRLHRSFLLQKEFLYDTSHELKTPLTTMRLAVESLRSHESQGDVDADDETVSRLESQIWRMDKLVHDLLTLSALEASNAINESAVDLKAGILRLVDDYAFIAEAKSIDLTCRLPEHPVVVRGDSEKLLRVFSNVLDNAIKYNNAEGGEVGVSMTETADGVVIVVENTGPSLSPEEAERVFDRLYRVERSRTFSATWGVGLGLTIVKKAVELHGGRIIFESRENGRNRFTIVLPNNRLIKNNTQR